MRRKIIITSKFAITLIVTTIIFTVLWQEFVTDRFYNCTDPGWLDYLFPGNWVHGHVTFVHEVSADRSMSDPDSIKEGWSVIGLWGLWYSFVAASLVSGVVLARIRWIPHWLAEKII